ncbi:MAG: sarcosine oxidase gamma subunit [Sphingomonadales bacterium]|nr:sarcosine oxidase gamma subunit [Sphingomonadales bacterium]
MADALLRCEPVPAAPAAYSGVTITLAPPMRRWSLRAKSRQALETHLGLSLPRKIGETLGDIACLGPDEWLWRAVDVEPKETGAGLPLSVVDVSERSVGIILEGHAARAMLNAGCPLDLERFAVGRMTRTIYEGVEIILSRESETRWSVDVWRSFAEHLLLSFTTVARNR